MKLRKMTKCSLAMLLAMMMVCTLAVPAFAGTDADEITAVVSDSNNNHENEANNETENGDAVIENDDNKGGSEPSEEGNGDATDTDNDSDVEEHIHSYKADVNGMCGGPADITYTCECGHSYEEHVDELAHDEIVAESLEANCTEGGYTVYQCLRCGGIQTRDVVEALGHSYEAVVTEPTCIMQGYTTYTCSRCGHSYTDDYTDNTDAHVWNEGTVTKEPSCTEVGEIVYVCDLCHTERADSIDMIAHDYVDDFEIEGMQEPTCTEKGVAMSTCSVCGHVENARIIEALGHTHQEGQVGVVTAPTCTMQGYTTYTCDRCGESYQSDYTDMIPHIRDEEMPGTVITPAAIGVEGAIEYVCRECGMPFIQAIPALTRPSGGGGGGGGAAPAGDTVIDEPDVPLASAFPFDDVKESIWYREAVQYVYDNELMSGESGTVFNPNGKATRGMIVKTLYSMEKKPAVSSAAVFSDIAEGEWYSDAVSWAAENKIVEGYEDGTFRQENGITRQELAAILYRYAEYKNYDVTGRTELTAYADANTVQDFAKDAMGWAVKAELVSGIEVNDTLVLAPRDGATRAQLASILMRFDKSFNVQESETK